MTKPRRYGGKSHPATPTQEQTRPISTETSSLVGKSTLFVIFPAKTGIKKTKVASWWPNRADMVENLIPRRQLRSKRDQYRRKLAIYTNNTLFVMSPAKTSLEQADTKPRRYGGKSHPAKPTQEQTRPMSTETSNLVGKSTLFVIFPAKTGIEKTKVASWWPNRADMVENLIPRRQLRSKRDQYRRKLAIYKKKYAVFDVSCKNGHWKKNVASWWPNRAGMAENLIPQCQLRSKRDQYRRKLAI